MGFWEKLFRTNSQVLPQSKEPPRYTLNYADARYIGILFNSMDDDNHGSINFFVKLLKKDGKKVRALAYFDDRHSNPYDFKFDFFTKEDLQRNHRVDTKEVNEFICEPFDYLYCISLQHFPVLDYIMHHSQARCRIGSYYPDADTHPYELMITLPAHQPQDIVSLTLQMMHYTKSLLVNNPPASHYEQVAYGRSKAS